MYLTAQLTDGTSEGQGAALGEPHWAPLALRGAQVSTDVHGMALSSHSSPTLTNNPTREPP